MRYALFLVLALIGFPASAATWTSCAAEGEVCTFPSNGTRNVRYGTAAQYITKKITNSTTCSAQAFGKDPASGQAKTCKYSSVATGGSGGSGCGTGIPTIACVAARNDMTTVTSTIVATSGQVIENKRISTTTGPCIRVLGSVTNVTIRDNNIGPCGTSSYTVDDVGVDISGLGNGVGDKQVTITRNLIHGAASGIRVTDTTNGVQITKNLFYAPQGPRWAGSAGAQMFRISGGTRQTLIQCNIIDESGSNRARVTEDHMNFGSAAGISNALPIEVAYNRIKGHPSGQTDNSGGSNESGSGLQSGDAQDSGTQPRYYYIHHNIVNKVNGSGLGFAGGVWDYRLEDNRVDNRGACAVQQWPGTSCSNTGWHYLMKNIYAGTTCSNITIKRNRGIAYLWAFNHNGLLVGDPTGGTGWADCAPAVTFGAGADANNWQDGTLDGDAMFAEAQPAICQ